MFRTTFTEFPLTASRLFVCTPLYARAVSVFSKRLEAAHD
jgi:hypothetical protein